MAEPSPVIVIGAGRSGTNLLRDLLCELEGFSTWPCDEINYIWRHGNRDADTDEFPVAFARPEVREFIRRRFASQRRRASGATVVEKTCANSVRVGFVHAVFPEARFVHIERDGRDVVASAMERWTAPLDVRYLARKARFVPPADLPYYALRYARSRVSRFGTEERRLSTWGPRFDGMVEAVRTRTLPEVCALQWKACVETASAQFDAEVDPSQVLRLRYEDLVAAPREELGRVADFVGAPGLPATLPRVSTTSVGRWRSKLSDDDAARVHDLIAPTLAARGYV